MSWKIVLAVLVLVILAVAAAYLIGHLRGRDAGDVACATAHAGDATTYAARETKAQERARQAQAAADRQQIDQLQHLLIQAQDAAAKATATAAKAQARTEQLNADLARLKHENADVAAWAGRCLPASLLASLHPQAELEDYPAACRSAGDGHTGAVPAYPGVPAAVH